MTPRFRCTLLATSALVPFSVAVASANPLGANVVAGTTTVQGQGTSTVTVTQSTDRSIINWNSFNIGAGDTTRFVQPNETSVTLNRVTGQLGPSAIDGTLTANGRVFLVNPDGILFGANSKVNTGGFLATTNDIRNADFMAGKYQFGIPGRSDASIVNLGTITAQSGGFAALVAPGVRNSGTITAKLGTVGLAAANSFSLDFYGDRLITVGVSDSIAAKVVDVATGRPLDALVKNEGKLKANGGRVELTAVAARHVIDSVINNKGLIEANSIGRRGGMIVLGGATGRSKPAGAPSQTVKLSGSLSVAGKQTNTKGGSVIVTGEAIELTAARIDASGNAGGGRVLIGGDIGGGTGNSAVAGKSAAALESFAIATASNVSVDAATTIEASAKTTGDGGKVVLWADQATTFFGTINAQGGARSGNGGFVETSGQQSLTFDGTVNTSAPHGESGTLLLDPINVTIGSGATTNGSFVAGNFSPTNIGSVLNGTSLQNALASGNVLVTTGVHGVGGPQAGDITVTAPISWSSRNTLTLNAINNIAINAAINGANGGLALSAFTISAGESVSVGTFRLNSGAWRQVTPNLPAFFAKDFQIPSTLSPQLFLRALGGDGSSGSPYQISDIYGLQGIGSTYGVNDRFFILANNIAAGGTTNWNNGAGFSPILFDGTLDGRRHTVDGLTIKSSASFVGLFSFIDGRATVKNIGLTNVNISPATSIADYANLGALAGSNFGTIIDSYATGVVDGSGLRNGISGGGLVGANSSVGQNNGGQIIQSYAAVNIVGPHDCNLTCAVGGLVGSNSATIRQSFATGSVAGGSNAAVGGLVGQNSGNPAAAAVITQSYAAGSVTGGVNSSVGGFVGLNRGTIDQAFAVGSVEGPSSSLMGGLVGQRGRAFLPGQSESVTNSYWDAQTTGQTKSAGGVGLTTSQLTVALPPGFSNSVWTISPRVSYPYLLTQPSNLRPIAPSNPPRIPITVTADGVSRTYGESDPPLDFRVTSGAIFGSDTFSGLLTRVAGENVGSYSILRGTLSLSSSYALTYQGANLTIMPRPITVTADAKSKTAGTTNPSLTYVIGGLGLVRGDSLSGTLETTATTASVAGTYPITRGTLGNPNYAISYTPANLTVTSTVIAPSVVSPLVIPPVVTLPVTPPVVLPPVVTPPPSVVSPPVIPPVVTLPVTPTVVLPPVVTPPLAVIPPVIPPVVTPPINPVIPATVTTPTTQSPQPILQPGELAFPTQQLASFNVFSMQIAQTTPATSLPINSLLNQKMRQNFPAESSYVLPAEPITTTPYGFFSLQYLQEENVRHLGVDIPVGAGASVRSPVTGIVVRNKSDPNAEENSYIVIRETSTGIEHVLGHIYSALPVGKKVDRGVEVGKVIHDHVHWGANVKGIPSVVKDGWGWGRAPANATVEQAKARGWIDLNSYLGI